MNVRLDPDQPLTLGDVMSVVRGGESVDLSERSEWRERMKDAVRVVNERLEETGDFYGVNTGLGDTSYRPVPPELVSELPENTARFHGCGMGEHLSAEETRAVLLVRLASLLNPASGVRIEVLEAIQSLINKNVLPLIPEEGSVGASGDLTPLSYIAAVLMGERRVWHRGNERPTEEVIDQFDHLPLDLAPKEALAIMNGTSVMAGLACLALDRADYLMKLSTAVTALVTLAMKGNPTHYDRRIFDWKPHPGQKKVAARLRDALGLEPEPEPVANDPSSERRKQDRYSLRCAPHIIGVLADAMPWMKEQIETEINSANDNPLVDPEKEDVLHGGNFYGGHVGFVMDSLKNPVANLADLMDRQFAQLVDPKLNRGLPPNLTGASSDRVPVNHGLKALQIGTSAWAAEALKKTGPASVYSRSTESHNQDKVSLGTISARECLRIIELVEQTAASLLVAGVQAVELRMEQQELGEEEIPPALRDLMSDVREISPRLEEDRALESELRELVGTIRNQKWTFFEET